MERVVLDRWNTVLRGFSRLLPWRESSARATREAEAPPAVLAVMPDGPGRILLESIAQDAGWVLSIYERAADVPRRAWPVIIYDRELSPAGWRDEVRALSRREPRPYLIVLSPHIDANLWDELQRIGGADLLRIPLERARLVEAVQRAGLVWKSQQMVRARRQRRA